MGAAGLRPVILAFLAAALWGLWWIPIRWFDALGLTGAAGGAAMNTGAFVSCLLWIVIRREPFFLGPGAVLGAACVGVAVGTYSVALNYGDVVRVILLFYLAPAWSKLIEWWFLNMPWRWTSTLALVAALSGAFLVLGGDIATTGVTLGDGLAVLSGIAWSVGATLIFVNPGRARPIPLSAVSALTATVIALLFMTIEGDWPTGGQGALVAGGLGLGLLYVVPILALTLWSAQVLSPATLTFLLTAEILAGVISSAILLDEPFGPLRVAGAALIVLGALSEILPSLLGQKVDPGQGPS